MRTIVARFAILLGVVGIALLGVGAIAAWCAAFAVADQTRHVTVRAADRLTMVEARLVRLEEKVMNVTVDVAEIREEAAEFIRQALSHALAQTEFQQLLDRFNRLLEQAETHGETLSIVSRLLEDTADLRAQLGQSEDQVERLHTIAEMLERTATSLLSIRGDLTVMRERQAEPDLRKLTDLADGVLVRLQNLVDGIDNLRQHSIDARAELDELYREVRFWSIAVSGILTVAFTWLALGQLCLIRWGRARLRKADT